ncbi:MAG: transketolase [Candidatus Eremiobacteraeota bacterium]|nr:transketolase [Candidatus Eremiobacteraeota bacterium]
MRLEPKRRIELERTANAVRQSIIESLVAAGSGHSAGSLDMADVFTALYFEVMRHNPKRPDWEERDRLLLSAGHICPVRYAAMAHAGYFPLEELLTLRKLGTRLQGHPERTRLESLETTSGPLGEGLAQGVGMAYGAKLDGKGFRVFVVTSDAEHQAGLHWEAAMVGGKYHLEKLISIVDRNFIQIDGGTEEVMPLEPFRAKYEAFGWEVRECNGNDMEDVVSTLRAALEATGKPQAIIAHTIPGKGVSFMENDYTWHGKPPKRDEAERALAELRQAAEKIGSAA